MVSFLLLLFPIVSCHVVTNLYGSLSGTQNPSIFNQGRITGITKWASDSKSNYDKIGIDAITNDCTGFSLTDPDYIDSFLVKWSANSYVRLISFHATNGVTYECKINNTYYNALNDLQSTGVVKFTGTQLTGFKFRYGSIIDAIGFQFSDVNPSITTAGVFGGYGGSVAADSFNQGRVNGISSWGYKSSYPSVIIGTWSADLQNSFVSFGENSVIDTNCAAFSLTPDQRIDGYRVMYDTSLTYVNYIGFQLSDGTTRECQVNSLPTSVIDTSWVTIYPPSYLSGFWGKVGQIIDSIGFQFTAVSLLCPSGSEQVGDIQSTNDIPGCGIATGCNDRMDTNNIVECRDKCIANVNCLAFNWTPKGGDTINVNDIVCTLYDTKTPTASFGYQIFCKLITSDPTKSPTQFPTRNPTVTLTCPSGTHQVGGLTSNNDINSCGLDGCTTRYDTNNIIECRDKCLAHTECIAFNYAPIGGDQLNMNLIVCSLYDVKIPNQSWLYYQIFCVIDTNNPTSDPTAAPTTSLPTTNIPTTATPTTSIPTTAIPTTNNPTTAQPTTHEPTAQPTTKQPTTYEPTTNEPTTHVPTTAEPTTSEPTVEDGEVSDQETTKMDVTSAGGNNNGNAAATIFGLNGNNMILYVIIGFIVILCCFICVLGFMYRKVNKKKKEINTNNENLHNHSMEMEKVRSTSAGEMFDVNTPQTTNTNTTNTVSVGETQTNEANINPLNAPISPAFNGVTPDGNINMNTGNIGMDNDSDEEEDDGLYNVTSVTKGGGNDIIVNNNMENNNDIMDENDIMNASESSDDNNMFYSSGNQQTAGD